MFSLHFFLSWTILVDISSPLCEQIHVKMDLAFIHSVSCTSLMKIYITHYFPISKWDCIQRNHSRCRMCYRIIYWLWGHMSYWRTLWVNCRRRQTRCWQSVCLCGKFEFFINNQYVTHTVIKKQTLDLFI